MFNRKQVAASAGRFVIAVALGIGIATHEVFERYKIYWNQTIFRVQTVDFNTLAHTLPTKLSYVLVKNQPKELQRTLDSNYSLFGLVVTDPSGKKILSSSGAGTTQKRSWAAALNPQQLQKHPYDLLLDPPPLLPQGIYSDPRNRVRQATGFKNPGRVIGRVYYVRGVPPTFQQDFQSLQRQPFSPSSRFQIYTPTMFSWLGAGLFGWVLLEWMSQTKRRQKRLAQQREQELKQREQKLVEDARNQLNALDAKEAEVRHLLSENSRYIELLKVAENNPQLSQLEKKLYEKQIGEYQLTKEALERELQETNQLRKNLEEANQQIQAAERGQRTSEEEICALKEQLDESAEAARRATLQWFELKVLQSIEKSSEYQNGNWRIRTCLNVSRRNTAAMETDLVVTSSYCAIVIEAKAYHGRIESEGGNVSGATWIHYSTSDGSKRLIACRHGANPYEQVRKYVKDAMKWFDRDNRPRTAPEWGRIYTYGVIVFPKGSDILNIEFGIPREFYRITTLDRLVETIKALNEDAKERLRRRGELSNRPSSKQAKDLLLGLYIESPKRAA